MTIVIIAAKRKEGNPTDRVPFLMATGCHLIVSAFRESSSPDGRWDSLVTCCGGLYIAVGVVGNYPIN